MNANDKSLRDEFAEFALCGILSGLSTANMRDRTDRLHTIKCIAVTAYEFADAMLVARIQNENPQTTH